MTVGHIVHLTLQNGNQLILADAGNIFHIAQVDTTIAVHREEEGFLRSVNMLYLIRDERDRTMENVGLDELTIGLVLHTQHVSSHRVIQNDALVTTLVERTMLGTKTVIGLIELLAKVCMLGLFLSFNIIQLIIKVTDCYIVTHNRIVARRKLVVRERIESGTSYLDTVQRTNLVTIGNNNAITPVGFQLTVIRTRL